MICGCYCPTFNQFCSLLWWAALKKQLGFRVGLPFVLSQRRSGFQVLIESTDHKKAQQSVAAILFLCLFCVEVNNGEWMSVDTLLIKHRKKRIKKLRNCRTIPHWKRKAQKHWNKGLKLKWTCNRFRAESSVN